MHEGEFLDFFALSVFRTSLKVDAAARKRFVSLLLNLEAADRRPRGEEQAWLGDVSGSEFLFSDGEFADLFADIGRAVRSYVSQLGLDESQLAFWFQRSWATISHQGERIFEHTHQQSHLSFAYYLKKPTDGGGIYFSVADHPNEFAPGLFTLTKEQLGLIKSPGPRTLNRVYVEPVEDEILVFPSRTLHSTAPNLTDQPRISISGDVVVTLKDSAGHETLMPPVERWKAF